MTEIEEIARLRELANCPGDPMREPRRSHVARYHCALAKAWETGQLVDAAQLAAMTAERDALVGARRDQKLTQAQVDRLLVLTNKIDDDLQESREYATALVQELKDRAVRSDALREAAKALGAMPEGYCFCSRDRIGDDSKTHEPECRDLRAILAASEKEAGK